jgi:hypothetical protein
MSYLRYLCLLHLVVSNTYCVVFYFVCRRIVYPMLPVSLDCPFVLCTLCCQFLWIVFVLGTLCCQFLWIVPSSWVPYVASFSGLSLRLGYPM